MGLIDGAPRGNVGYRGTKAAILSGSTGKDYNNRALTKAVNTGWSPKDNEVCDSDTITI